MKIVDRYIAKTVISTTLVVMLVIVVLDTFFNLLRELEGLGKGSYGFDDLLIYLLLTLPRRLNQMLPLALLIGGLLGMGSLAASSELAVMRASGLSPIRLAFAALGAGLVLSLIAMLLGEYIAPHSEKLAQELRTQAKSGSNAPLGHGFWARDGNLFINVGAVLPGPRLLAIEIYQLDEQSRLTSITEAPAADYRDGRWHLQSVTRSILDPEGVSTDALPEVAWDSIIGPDTLEVLAAKPEDLAISELRTYISYLANSGLDTRNYALAFWNKALAPLTNLALLFVALAFAFTPQRSGGAGQRLLIGVLLGLLFFLLDRMLGNLVLLLGYHPLFGASLPLLLFFIIGVVALRRTH